MGTEHVDLLRMLDASFVRVQQNKVACTKGWPKLELTDEQIDSTLLTPTLGLGLKLGGATGFIDIEGDSGLDDTDTAAKAWEDLTRGITVPPTLSWASSKGVHRIFRLNKELRGIVGEDRHKMPEKLEIRLGVEGAYSMYSIIPDCAGRTWVGPPTEAALLPMEIALRIQDMRFNFKEEALAKITGRQEDVEPWRPGSIFNREASWHDLLSEAGWTHVKDLEDVSYWKRPGHTDQLWSGSIGYCGDNLWLWTDSVPGFEALQPYNKQAFHAITNCGGDFREATRQIIDMGFVDRDAEARAAAESMAAIEEIVEGGDDIEGERTTDDCYQIPTKLLKIPGLVSWVSEYHAQRHVNKDYKLAAVGAYSLLALAGSRRVELDDHTRPNLFTMILGPSTCGKSSMISTVNSLADEAGFREELYGDFKSSESMQDAVVRSPVILSTIDECQHRLKMLSDEKDKAAGSYSSELKKLATAAKGTWQRRSGLGKEGKGEVVQQPHLSGLWCGITDNAWPAIPDDMLGDGFIGRFMIVEVTVGELNLDMYENTDLRNKIVSHLKKLRAVQVDQKAPPKIDGCDESEAFIPVPKVVRHTPEAAALSQKMRIEWHAKMKDATEKKDKAASAYGRMHEFMCRLELLISLSANTDLRPITLEQTTWAIALTKALTRFKSERMNDKPRDSSQYEKDCEWVKNKLMRYSGRRYPWAKLSRESPYDIPPFDRLIHSMEEQGRLFTDRVFDNYGRSIRHNGSYICLPRHRDGATKKYKKSEK